MTAQKKPAGPEPAAKVFGTQFLPEVRTVCNLLDLAGKSYIEDNSFDVFTETGQKEFAAFNPAQSQPVVIIEKTNLLADPSTLCKYICRKYSLNDFYPLGDDEDDVINRQTIDRILEVNQVQFKRTCERLTKLAFQKKCRAVGKMPELTEAQ